MIEENFNWRKMLSERKKKRIRIDAERIAKEPITYDLERLLIKTKLLLGLKVNYLPKRTLQF
jgi:hypothetical protein